MDDLILMGRIDEAERLLQARLRKRDDGALRLKLAEVLGRQERVDDALHAYVQAAEAFQRQGFLAKARAALLRAQRLSPTNEGVATRLRRLSETRNLEQLRRRAVDMLIAANRSETGALATAAIELEQTWDRLADTEFIRATPQEQTLILLSNMQLVRFGSGELVCRRGDRRPELFLVASGEIEASTRLEETVTLRSFGAGEVLGEEALLKSAPWPADLRATGPSSALRLRRQAFERCLQGNPDPQALIGALRAQGHDARLRGHVHQLVAG